MGLEASTDLSDNEWARLRSYLPALPKDGQDTSLFSTEIFDATFYVLNRLSLAALAPRLPALADGLLPLSQLSPRRVVALRSQNPVHGRT